MSKILGKLTGGDLRSDGRAGEVAEDVIKNPALLQDLMKGFESRDNVVRMRTVDALEKISRKNPEIMEGIKRRLFDVARKDKLPEVRWHLAQVFANIPLTKEERDEAIAILFDWLKGGSILVKAWSIHTLGILAAKNRDLQRAVLDKIKTFQNDKSPAVRNRVKQVLLRFS